MLRHESRSIGRREALSMLGASAWAARLAGAASDPALHFGGLDHIEFTVSDVSKSIAFYARVFGNTVLKNNKTTRRYLQLGRCYIAMEQAQEVHVDHFCAGIEAFQIAGLHTYLEQRGIAYRDYPSGHDLYVTDPDGTRLQLGADSSWSSLLGGTASPESLSSGEPVFHATGFDHILVNVSDPAKSAAFYEKIFGPVARRNNNRTWFQAGKTQIGLLETPAGQRAGVNHYCVAAASFDYAEAIKKLEQASARPVEPEVRGAPEFRDPDGLLIQVMGPRTR
ncbi:MAG TPA: VOC family protein [Bryobacteraceae bacterium]|jgi:catechol 2,3-dioxygenase-like lactoylglutathione lyase family enzyme|nr:VOC family protein [Bryobacteraceae bacterium]